MRLNSNERTESAMTVNNTENNVVNTSAPQFTSPYPSPAPFVCDRIDHFLLPIALLIGILLREWIFSGVHAGFSVIAAVAALYLGIFLYGVRCAQFSARRGSFLWLPIGLTLLCFALFHNPFLAFWDLILLYALIALHVGRMFGYRKPALFSDAVWCSIRAPFANLSAAPKTLLHIRKTSRSKNVWRVACGLLISVPIALVVLALLSSAEDAFSNALQTLQNNLGSAIGRVVLDLIIGALLATVLFSLLYTLRYLPKCPETAAVSVRFRPDSVIVTTILVVCAVIYCCFFAVQFHYLFSAVWGSLPGGEIYSSYARRGFFELLMVAFINLLLALLAARSSKADALPVRIAVVVLGMQTLLLIASATAKMIMYVNIYGMSPLRLYASWFMVVLAFVFIVLLLAQFIRKLKVQNTWCCGILVLFLLLNFIAPNRTIAQWNTNRYLDGTLPRIDVSLLEDLGPEAVPSLVALRDTASDDSVVRLANNALHNLHEELNRAPDWRGMNVPTLFAMPFDGMAIEPEPTSFQVRLSNQTDVYVAKILIYGAHNDRGVFEKSVSSADTLLPAPNSPITLYCDQTDFWDKVALDEVVVYMVVYSAEGEELVHEKILSAPVYGESYQYTLIGNHKIGFRLDAQYGNDL